MRVLVVTGLTHYGHGGVQRETVSLIRSLVQLGVEVGAMSDIPPIAEGIEHFPIRFPPDAQIGLELDKAERQFLPDVIHIIGGGVSMLRHIAASRPTAPWLITIHNIPPFERGSVHFPGHNRLHYALRDLAGLPSNLVWRQFLSRAGFTHAICHSEMVAQRAVANGCPAGKIVDIPLAADFPAAPIEISAPGEAIFPSAASPRILSIGGLIHHKGFHDFLPVAAALRRDWPNLHYCVMGEARGWPKYQQHLLLLAERLGMKDRFTLLLGASEEQRLRALATSDLYVQPSHEEGFCLSFLEAVAEVPLAIGTRTGAIASIARDLRGVAVVPAKNPKELEAAARSLLIQSVSKQQLEQRRKVLNERFSWENHARLHLELYTSIAQQAHGPDQRQMRRAR